MDPRMSNGIEDRGVLGLDLSNLYNPRDFDGTTDKPISQHVAEAGRNSGEDRKKTKVAKEINSDSCHYPGSLPRVGQWTATVGRRGL